MARAVAIGADVFEGMRVNDAFLVDKTAFIGEWWRGHDKVTLICRPRRFGKTLTLSMVERFLSNHYDRDETDRLFEGLEVTGDEQMMALMSHVPVVSLSFADVKDTTYAEAVANVKMILSEAVDDYAYLMDSDAITANDRRFLAGVTDDMDDDVAMDCIRELCHMLKKHWGVEPVVLLDEYDTPLVLAWEHGYWNEMVDFVRGLFNSTFKDNDHLGRALITGITRVAQESIFLDMNNLAVVVTTTRKYETSFGFTEREVAAALADYGMADRLDEAREWYDGFTFGDTPGIYNPWSVTGMLDEGEPACYWADTSSDELVSEVVRANPEVMQRFETLMDGGTLTVDVNERVTLARLFDGPGAVWPLLLAAGYLRVVRRIPVDLSALPRRARAKAARFKRLELALTNLEVEALFQDLISSWFGTEGDELVPLARALLSGDEATVQAELGEVVSNCVSSFDAGAKPSPKSRPECFTCGLTLGMLVSLIDKGYEVRSNLESGLGRLDVAIIPADTTKAACVIEFKVRDVASGEKTLEDTCKKALQQIVDKRYDEAIVSRGIDAANIRHFGIAFSGKEILVRCGA